MSATPLPLTAVECERLFAPFAGAAGLLLAVSGGPDSTALMHLAMSWRAAAAGRPTMAVACVDHGLRAEAREEAEAVATAAALLGCPATVLPWTGPKPVRAVQERARDARYALLVAHAAAIGASHLVTAHTLDDQAETVLFRIARGSGIAGLAGMRDATERAGLIHLRPFLAIAKARLIATCRANGWAYAEDPANRDPRFARSRWRALQARLDAEGLTAERLGLLARRAARVEAALSHAVAALDAAATRPGDREGVQFDAGRLAAAPNEILGRVLAGSIARIAPPGRLRLDRLEALTAALRAAFEARRPLRRTLGGAAVTFGDGLVRITRASPRRARPTT